MSNNMPLIFALGFILITVFAWYSITLGERLLARYRQRFESDTEDELGGMYVFTDSKKLFAYYACGLIAVPAFIYLLSTNATYTVIAFLLVLASPKVVIWKLRKRWLTELEFALPDALVQMAGSMRVGSSLMGSIEAMVNETKGPLAKEFEQLLKECKVGMSLEDALANLDARVPSENLSLVIAATNISKEVGGNLGETYERMGEMLRQKLTLETRIDALTAQGRMQGVVVGLLPIAICLVMFQMEPHTMSYLTTSLFGWITMLIIAVLLGMGGFMIRKIVNIDV
ncbi:MAG: type II secretion system F family protein [Granulosicoccaceae bacterium]